MLKASLQAHGCRRDSVGLLNPCSLSHPGLRCQALTRSPGSTSNLGFYERGYSREPRWGIRLGDKMKGKKMRKSDQKNKRLCAAHCAWPKPEAERALVLQPLIPLWSNSLRSQVARRLEVARKSAINHPTWGLTGRFVHHLY